MNNILITLKKELKLIIRDKKSLLMMAITPLFIPIFVILMSYIYEELTVNKDDKTYVEPDISVVCNENKLDDKGCNGAPDWIIEIVSPGSRRMDYGIKLFKYRSSGVREYWIVDPDKQRIIVYDLEHDDVEEYTFKDKIKARIYDELWIDFKNL